MDDLLNHWLFDPEACTAGDYVEYPSDVQRPRTRGECEGGERPCPFVSCRHHLYLDVNPRTGAIKMNFPHLQVWEMTETCALDLADQAGKRGLSLGALARAMGLSYDRAFQVVSEALAKAREAVAEAAAEGDE